MAKIIDGKEVGKLKKEALRGRIAELKAKGKTPRLVSLQVGHDPNSQVYLNAQQRNALNLGIDYEVKHFEDTLSREVMIYNLNRLNEDKSIDAIIIQTPLPEHLDYNDVVQFIDKNKDVEGTHPFNMGRLALGDDLLAPPTAKAVCDMIDHIDYDLYGKNVTVVGNSDIVGKPLALMLSNRMATVSVAHIATSKAGLLEQYVANADLLVVAVGKSRLIKGEWLKDSAVVLDVGINYCDGSICGDVDYESAQKVASYITPVPGGVGSVTSMVLMENAVLLAEQNIK